MYWNRYLRSGKRADSLCLTDTYDVLKCKKIKKGEIMAQSLTDTYDVLKWHEKYNKRCEWWCLTDTYDVLK